VTDLLAGESAQVLRRFARGTRPFFLWESHIAPHDACVPIEGASCWGPPRPSGRDSHRLENVRPPSFRDPAFLERDVHDKPAYLRGLGRSRERRELIGLYFTRRIQSLQAVDRAVARTIRVLRATGELGRTVVIFTSDNGFLLGEHRWMYKSRPCRCPC
jgi:N-acetylglucosamine-6-sulfatase